ncbi:hypothetical protein B0H11DRAFT_2309602 [Mycena galericulata]|nr:hypothetical protein B0H11DRAFT_2309602 [Mycena galericulata]
MTLMREPRDASRYNGFHSRQSCQAPAFKWAGGAVEGRGDVGWRYPRPLPFLLLRSLSSLHFPVLARALHRCQPLRGPLAAEGHTTRIATASLGPPRCAVPCPRRFRLGRASPCSPAPCTASSRFTSLWEPERTLPASPPRVSDLLAAPFRAPSISAPPRFPALARPLRCFQPLSEPLGAEGHLTRVPPTPRIQLSIPLFPLHRFGSRMHPGPYRPSAARICLALNARRPPTGSFSPRMPPRFGWLVRCTSNPFTPQFLGPLRVPFFRFEMFGGMASVIYLLMSLEAVFGLDCPVYMEADLVPYDAEESKAHEENTFELYCRRSD